MDLQQEGAEDVLMDGDDAGDQRGLESPLHFCEILAPRVTRVEPLALARRPRRLLRGLKVAASTWALG